MRQLGFSLVELMLGIVLASFIALAAATYYSSLFSASHLVRTTGAAQAQFTAVTSAAVAEIRRSGYRGYPGRIPTYLQTTGSSGGVPDEGDNPAVELGTECVLVSYVRDHTCGVGEETKFAECAGGEGTAAGLYYRVGLRLRSGVLEAVSVVHPNQFLTATSDDSSCAAIGTPSVWQPLTSRGDLYVDRFSVSQAYQEVFDGDAGCVLGTAGTACEDAAFTDCGDVISCRIKRAYRVEVCTYDAVEDGLCDPDFGPNVPAGQRYNELFVTPRNDVLISRDYST